MIVMIHKIVIKYVKTNIYRKICIFFHFSLFLNPKVVATKMNFGLHNFLFTICTWEMSKAKSQ